MWQGRGQERWRGWTCCENETILIVEEVSRSLAGLQLMGEGLRPWESEEYQWIENIDTTKDKEEESLNTPWFDWGEEKREHWDLRLLHSLEFFILIIFIQVFLCFYIDRLENILGGEGGCRDWFFIRLLTRDPPSGLCSMQR